MARIALSRTRFVISLNLMVISVMRRGILIAGGTGSRLGPLTQVSNKHFLPVFDKPMIFYSLSLLMLAKVNEIAVVCRGEDLSNFQNLLGDGGDLGMRINYHVQDENLGIPDAILKAKDARCDSRMVVLGDTFLSGGFLMQILQNRASKYGRASIFSQPVRDPHRFGVAQFSPVDGQFKSVIEKPKATDSNSAVIGVYMFPEDIFDRCALAKVSDRGETEISDVINSYAFDGLVDHQGFGRGYAWRDMGTCDALFDASMWVKTSQEMQSLPLALLPEISFNNGWIGGSDLYSLSEDPRFNSHAAYLRQIIT